MLFALLVVPTAAQARSFGSRVLAEGAHGSDVKALQRLLNQAGFATTVDGAFGPGTKSTVEDWETAAARTVDGRVTRPDARALRADAADGADDPDQAAPLSADTAPAATPEPTPGGGASYVDVEPGTVNKDGTATAPESAPAAVAAIVDGGNEIFDKPYVYGGGHGKWKDRGYDCSGSVSYALHKAGLLDTSLDSTGFESYGDPGPGMWVTIYANSGHAYMVVAGMRFDTSGASAAGSRWQSEMRSSKGYVVRHPPGL